MSLTYSAPAVNLTLKIIESYDIELAPLLKKLDIDAKRIEDPNARFRYAKIDQLWLEAVSISNDPCFGLRAAIYWHPSQIGALGYAWLASASLRTALNRFSRYMPMLTEGATLDIDEVNGELSVHLKYKTISMQQPTRTDSFMAMLLAMCRANCGQDFHPLSVSFTHPKPEKSNEFYALFQCPVHFDAEEDRFNLSAEVADKKLISANPQLAQCSDQIIIETLARLVKDDIVTQIKSEIIKQLQSGQVTETTVSSNINISKRNLQRKLQQAGTSFKTLLNELRLDLAKKYLRNSNLSLTDIAFLLGFSEYSSFSRAFKKWTGLNPSQYRDK